MNSYKQERVNGFAIVHGSKPIVAAEQMQPDSRAARRQAAREAERKRPIKYARPKVTFNETIKEEEL